jgi:hypothetical protein
VEYANGDSISRAANPLIITSANEQPA